MNLNPPKTVYVVCSLKCTRSYLLTDIFFFLSNHKISTIVSLMFCSYKNTDVFLLCPYCSSYIDTGDTGEGHWPLWDGQPQYESSIEVVSLLNNYTDHN